MARWEAGHAWHELASWRATVLVILVFRSTPWVCYGIYYADGVCTR